MMGLRERKRQRTHDAVSAADALAETTHGPDRLTARLAAAQIIAVRRVLARENWRRLAAGETAAALHDPARACADNAFRLLASGLGRLAERHDRTVIARPDQ